ncbi:MAG: hypothetical protein A4E66_02235 [Syntrophus sp. PtaB.Bin001]|nr:MAG: hypothetical protein A4E66_02235 [Syntrophus sp. PtaB.Bin001]
MDPGTLIPDVGQLEEIGIQPGLPQGLPEKGFVSLGSAGRHHDPVEPVFFNLFLDLREAGIRAGVHRVGGDGHIGIAGNRCGHLFDVDRRGDVDPAVADEHADTRLFIRHVVFDGITLLGNKGIARLRQQFHGHGRCSTGLGDRFRDVLRLLESARDKDAGLRCFQRQKPTGLAESEFVELDA